MVVVVVVKCISINPLCPKLKFARVHCVPNYNLKWRRSEVASTNSKNSLRFLQVKMNTMSNGINGDVNKEDCGTFLTQYEALHRRAWPKKTNR